jgi:hypothetical protein
MVAMKMRQEDGLDVARVDAHAMQMGQQRRAAIKQQSAIHDDRPVVAVQRKRRPATEEGELYAMVTAWLRYTS